MSALMVLGSFMDEGTVLAPLSLFLLLYFVPGPVALWGGRRAFHPCKGLKYIKKGVSVILKMSLNFLHCLVNSLLY